MSYEVFCRRVNAVAKRVGAKARFFREDGKHIAYCTHGITIVGNSESQKVFVQWGDGHAAFALI